MVADEGNPSGALRCAPRRGGGERERRGTEARKKPKQKTAHRSGVSERVMCRKRTAERCTSGGNERNTENGGPTGEEAGRANGKGG